MSSLDPTRANNMSEADKDRFWRSFAELEDSPEFLETLADEFPEQAEELADPLSRRRFFQLMGASLALAGVAPACRWEEDHVVPLSRRPENYVPGVPKYFATSMEVAGVASALVARSFDGRPIKIEGNDQHPASVGRSTALEQAAILHLYDPDRSRAPTFRKDKGEPAGSTMEDFEHMWRETARVLKVAKGKGFAILSEGTSSPTMARLRAKLTTEDVMKDAQWYEWDPINFDNEAAGMKLAFGAPRRVHYTIEKAQTILALDCDFLGSHPARLKYAAQFAKGRNPERVMNRLYAVESAFSITGASADHRLPLRSDLIKPFLLAVEKGVTSGEAAISQVDSAALKDEDVAKFAAAVAFDLKTGTRETQALICVGPSQPPEVHAIAARLNHTLRAVGSTVSYTDLSDEPTQVEQMRKLAADMSSGQVKTLLILGGNPAYNAPADLNFAGLLAKHPHAVHLSPYMNETSAVSTWHVPRTHFLEEWGDAASWDGTWTLRQPLIRPLYNGRSAYELVKELVGWGGKSDHKLVAETFSNSKGSSELAWKAAVQKGLVAGSLFSKSEDATPNVRLQPLTASQKSGLKTTNGQLEVSFTPSSSTYDGRFANNAWLQETPDFLTKLTWDNAALIGRDTAADLKIANEEIVSITIDGREMTLPAYIMPGQADSSIAIALGYGREHAGVVAGYVGKVDSVGANAYKIRGSKGLGFSGGATIKGTGKKHQLASTQEHWAIDERAREEVETRAPLLVKEATAAEYNGKDRGFVRKAGHTKDWERLQSPKTAMGSKDGESAKWNMFETKRDYTESYKWGMTIDLGACTGCNSCMVACQAENNVPVVGKAQVLKNREMHWIRIDRYFKGDIKNPRIFHQPVHCQQCENAPCEQVCPVGATLHSTEGLNDMTYNRCVGTRYCANNCPYKVRRFNFHHWNKGFDEARNKVRELLFNPEVTVRSRGVMEKCTWCIQRISAKTIEVRNEQVTNKERVLEDGAIQTACQQACPSDAITFGDLNNKKAKVSIAQNEDRAYFLLADLNNRPRNAYLARIRNPNPALEKPTESKAH